MSVTIRAGIPVVAVAFLACASDPEPVVRVLPPNGPTTVVVAGDVYPTAPAYAPMGSIAFYRTSTWGSSITFTLTVELSWVPDMCREVDDDIRHPGTGFVWAELQITRDDGVPEVPPGTYHTGTEPFPEFGAGEVYGTAGLFVYGPLCYRVVDIVGQGTIAIASADERRIAGSVDLLFTDGTTAAGSFDAPVCPTTGHGDLVCLP